MWTLGIAMLDRIVTDVIEMNLKILFILEGVNVGWAVPTLQLHEPQRLLSGMIFNGSEIRCFGVPVIARATPIRGIPSNFHPMMKT